MKKVPPKRRMIPSWFAYVLTLTILPAGFVWTTFHPAAPYGSLVEGTVALAGIYFVKRTYDKKINITKDCSNGSTG
jgi:hypothetical protein